MNSLLFVKLQLIRFIAISQNWEQKKKKKKNPTSRVWTFVRVRKQKKVNCCPIFLGTLRAITVWLLVITTQSRLSKDALSDFTQQQNPKVVWFCGVFYSDLHAVVADNHFWRALPRCWHSDCPDKQHESSFLSLISESQTFCRGLCL